MRPLGRLADLSPTKIAGGYLVFGGLWILLSDAVLHRLVQRPEVITQLQTVKGWAFVLASGLLILGLVETRERQLQTSRGRLSRANTELRVLHRVFRHNIRNDLNVVRGYLELVSTQLEELKLSQQLDRAHASTDRILGFSEKVELVEVADPTTSTDDHVDVMAVIEDEVEGLETDHPGVTVAVTADSPVRVRADRSLSYVVRELLQNAVVHHDGRPEDCRIEIAVERTPSAVEVTIADNGPGMSDYEIQALESGEETQLVHTSGVGLWLVKWLSGFYDGEVAIDRREAGGTVVTLRFEPASRLEHTIERTFGAAPLPAAA